MSAFSRSMRSTMPPIGSSTSGIQRSSSSVTPGLLPFRPRTPRDLGGGDDEDDREELPEERLWDDLGELRAPDGGPGGRDTDDRGAAPAHVPVALLAPDPDGDRGNDGEERRRLGVELRETEPCERRDEENAAADAEEARQHAGDGSEHDGEGVRHFTRRSTAIPTSNAANASDRARALTRCCNDAPPSAPAAAGTPSSAAYFSSTSWWKT